jgi:hypothetical protein
MRIAERRRRSRLCGGARSKLSMRWRYVEAQATVLLNDDGFAVLDCERPDIDSKLGGNGSDWFDVSGERVGKRHALPLVARFTTDRWDNTVGVCDQFDTQLRRRRAQQLPRLAARHAVSAVGRAAPAGARHAGRTASCASPSRARLAASRRLRAAVCARSSNSACCHWRAASTRPLSRSWLHTVRSFTTPTLALRLSRRPLRQTAAPLQRAGAARRTCSAARSATRSCRARAPRSATCSTPGCRGTTRATFSPTASCLPTAARFWRRWRAHTRSRSPVGQLQ